MKGARENGDSTGYRLTGFNHAGNNGFTNILIEVQFNPMVERESEDVDRQEWAFRSHFIVRGSVAC